MLVAAYWTSVWACRRFWLNLVANDLQLRYRRSVLGVGWSLLMPMCTALVLGAVFHSVFQVPVLEFLPYLLSGLSLWAYLTCATIDGCQSYIQAESYIRQHSLPLVIYPLRTTLGALIHLGIALGLVFVFVQCTTGYDSPLSLLHLIPGLVLLFMCGWAVGVLFGFVNTLFRDTQHILQVGFQILFYLTPVMYPATILQNTWMEPVTRYNPLAHFLTLIRAPLLHSAPPPLISYTWAVGMCVALALAAVYTLSYQQKRIILHL